MKNNVYSKYISDCSSKFKSYLNSKENKFISFYILNKEFIDIPNLRGNSNKKILKINDEQQEIDKEKLFYLIDDETWKKIKSDYPNEIELKVNGSFDNKKYTFNITPKIIYFYFIKY